MELPLLRTWSSPLLAGPCAGGQDPHSGGAQQRQPATAEDLLDSPAVEENFENAPATAEVLVVAPVVEEDLIVGPRASEGDLYLAAFCLAFLAAFLACLVTSVVANMGSSGWAGPSYALYFMHCILCIAFHAL